jgi:hypothetical protein
MELRTKMKTIKIIILMVVMLVAACTEDRYSPTIRFPYEWIGEQGFGGYIDLRDFPEPSGICFHPSRKTFFVVSDEGDIMENGIESIAFVANEKHPEGGTFFVGNQWDPPCVLEVYVPLKTSQEKSTEARILRVLPLVLDDPSAMFYDTMTGLLNVVSDADNILVEITLEGRIVREYAFIGDNQEGIARDDEGYLYIAQDSGGLLKVKDLR